MPRDIFYPRSETKKKIVFIVTAVIFTISFAGLGERSFPNSQLTYSGIHEQVTIGTQHAESSAFIYIAEDRGFFTDNSLYVTIKDDYDSGADALKGMLNYEADISVSAEYPIVIEALKGENLSIIGCVDKYEGTYLVARKDKRFNDAADLKGKRIGLLLGTEAEFYLGRCLELHGMSLEDIVLVNCDPSQSAIALVNGNIDAFVLEYNLIGPVKELLGDNMIIWPQQNRQLAFAVMACRSDWMGSNRELINRFLNALAQAEEYTIVHPKIAKAIVKKRLNRNDEYMSAVWPNHQFSLSLDQSLITAMEDESRWVIKNSLMTEKAMPDYRNCIYTKGLAAVKSESVNIQ